MMDTTNLKRRGNVWFARVVIPRKDRAALGGRTELLRSLKTTSHAEARRLRHRVVHELQEEISRRLVSASLSPGTVEYVIDAAREQRAAVLNGTIDEQTAEAGLDATVEAFLDGAARVRGLDDEGDPHMTEAEQRALQLAHKVLRGDQAALLQDQVRSHLAEVKERVTPGALADKERQLNEFAKWAGNVEVSTLTRQLCGRYVREIIQTSGLAVKTRRKWLSNLHVFGEDCETYGLIDVNPFMGLAKLLKESTRGDGRRKPRPWTPEEFARLIQRLPAGSPLLPLACLAGYSGARIEELCDLRLDDVIDDTFRIAEAKNPNSVRFVPIHPAIASMVEKLRGTSDDGYLISGLLPGGTDAKRSHFASKYFGRFIRANGFTDPTVNFHSLRKSWTQRAETAGVPLSTCQLIDGHARQSLSYGLYSPGPDFVVLVEAMTKVSYGAGCEELVQQRIDDAVITEKMKRRVFKKARAGAS